MNVTHVQAAARPDQSVKTGNRMRYHGFKTRDLGRDVHLLGGCFHLHMYGRDFHTHASAYLVCGSAGNMLIDTGHARDGENIIRHVRSIVGERLTHVFPTHEEYPHAGNLAALMAAFPKAQVVGEVRNFHLYYPEAAQAGRFTQMQAGEQVDLGNRCITILPAVVHDLPATYWAYDDLAQIMFVSDGFGYSHTEEEHCTLLSGELPFKPGLDDTRMVLDLALYWTRFADKRAIIADMQALLEKYPTRLVAPAHGNVVTNVAEMGRLMDEALITQAG